MGSAAFRNFFLENLVQAGAGLIDGGFRAERLPLNLASTVLNRQVPALFAYLARLPIADALERDTKGESDFTWPWEPDGTVWRRMFARVPGLRNTLPPQLDPFGEEVPGRHADDEPLIPGLPLVPGFTSWPKQSRQRYDETIAILNEYDLHVPVTPEEIGLPGSKLGAPIKLSEGEQGVYARAFGEALPDLVARVYNAPGFVNANPGLRDENPDRTRFDVRQRALGRAISAARKSAEGAVVLGIPDANRREEIRRRLIESRAERVAPELPE
jgi:hypothetical protein